MRSPSNIGHRGCAISSRFAVIRRAKAHASSRIRAAMRSEEHTSELQSLMRISYAVFCLKKKKKNLNNNNTQQHYKITTIVVLDRQYNHITCHQEILHKYCQ